MGGLDLTFTSWPRHKHSFLLVSDRKEHWRCFSNIEETSLEKGMHYSTALGISTMIPTLGLIRDFSNIHVSRKLPE
jgi:hypothetical protein